MASKHTNFKKNFLSFKKSSTVHVAALLNKMSALNHKSPHVLGIVFYLLYNIKKILFPTAETSLEMGNLLSYAYLESRHSLLINLLQLMNK